MNNITTPVDPNLNTWGYQSDIADWDMFLSSAFIPKSLIEQKEIYRQVIMTSLNAFSSLARVREVTIVPIFDAPQKVKWAVLQWNKSENYQQYLERVYATLMDYPAEIYEIDCLVDMNIFIYTPESTKQPIRSWVRYFEESEAMGRFHIAIAIEDDEPYVSFDINHSLFSCSLGDDNREIYELNNPLLETSLKQWEHFFNSKIEVGGYGGAYEYGFLSG